METLQKKSLFWDVVTVEPQKNADFIIERILRYGEEEDFKWMCGFYGEEKIKSVILKSKALDKKSLLFWCQFFNIDKIKCTQKQSVRK